MVRNIKDTKAYCIIKGKNEKSPYLEKIDELFDRASNFLPKINYVFPNYTEHGVVHSLNVADYMVAICDQPEQLSELELTILIYAALLHDTGMIVSDDEMRKIETDSGNITTRKYSIVFEKYKDRMTALQECIRPVHGQRSKSYIMGMDVNLFILPGYTNISFQENVANICAAHNEDFEWIVNNLQMDQKKGSWVINSQYIAILLRIADCLDIDEKRAPYYLYKYFSPKDYGDAEWCKHFVIENKEKVEIDKNTGRKGIVLYGESDNPNIHRKLLKYFDAINDELQKAVDHSETFRDRKYLLSIETTVHNKIITRGFTFSDFKLSLDYNAVTSLLMGENIYGDKKYGLRELIQNSIDACMVMKEEAYSASEFKYGPYQPFIRIILDHDRKQVIIFDNGRGMSIDILKKYFLNVGVSYYVSDDYLFRGNTYTPIGNYGVGFLACFMLSDKVNVITKFFGENKANKIEFEKSSEYICLTCEEVSRSQGTEIILDYDQFMAAFDNISANVENFVQNNFIDSSIPVRLTESRDGKSSERALELKSADILCPDGKNLTEYFDGMDVILQFSYKGINFLKTFSDIYGSESLVYMDTNHTLERADESEKPILLKNYINSGTVKYLRVPIIPSSEEDKFTKAYEVLEDFDEALRKIDYEDANIIAADTFLYHSSELLTHGYDYIIGEYPLSKFRSEVRHAPHLPTYTYLEEKKVIEGNGEKILPYHTNVFFLGEYSFERTDYLYIKNVLISRAHLKIPFLAEGIELKRLVINVTSKKVIPNVSRNNISDVQNQELSYAVGKALHTWVYEHGNLGGEEKELIRTFIEKCYPQKSDYLKSSI